MKTILLLHGAAGSQEDLFALRNALTPYFSVFTLNFHGHGGTEINDDFSVELFARQVLEWMEEQKLEAVSIVGYSLGGYVAVYMALMFPQKLEKVVAIATKFYWDNSVANKMAHRLNPDVMLQRFPEYPPMLQQKHSDQWRNVLTKTAAMMLHIGEFNPLRLEDFSKINVPVLLVLGDRDKIVSFVETTTVYKELPNAQMAVLANTGHDLTDASIPRLAIIIQTFMAG